MSLLSPSSEATQDANPRWRIFAIGLTLVLLVSGIGFFLMGCGLLYSRHVLQADLGCDFDFLETRAGERGAEPEIH